jgi:putative FmdB family regulatory protein
MPIYAYRCADGHTFDQLTKIDLSDAPTRCRVCVDPESLNCRCEAAVTRVPATPARVFPGADSWRSKNGA